MLRMQGPQAECLWDEVLPAQVRELPEDLARIDELIADPALLEPIAEHWRREGVERGRDASAHGRPTLAMATYVRLMVVKHRSGWGYEALVKEVSDSLYLRRFCGLAIDSRLPDESTVRKLTRRLGSEAVAEITRAVIAKAARERRFSPRAARIDSTVIEADVRYPSDAMLALQGARALARQGQRPGERVGGSTKAVRDRSRAIGRQVRQISRTIGRRSGEARKQVIELNRQAGELLRSSAARGSLGGPRARRAGKAARSQGDRAARRALRASRRADSAAGQGPQDHRPARLAFGSRGEADPKGQGRQADRVRLRRPDLRAHPLDQTGSARPDRARRHRPWQPRREHAAASDRAEIEGLGLRPKEVALDGGFGHLKSDRQLAGLEPERVFVSGRRGPGSRRTKRRLRRYRTGTEGRISHLKRGYGLKRSRLKGHEGQRIWTGWGILAYDLDTLAVWES